MFKLKSNMVKEKRKRRVCYHSNTYMSLLQIRRFVQQHIQKVLLSVSFWFDMSWGGGIKNTQPHVCYCEGEQHTTYSLSNLCNPLQQPQRQVKPKEHGATDTQKQRQSDQILHLHKEPGDGLSIYSLRVAFLLKHIWCPAK